MFFSEYCNQDLLNELQALLNVDVTSGLKDINLNKGITTLYFEEAKKQLNIEIRTKFPFIKEVAENVVDIFTKSFNFAKFINVFVECDYKQPLNRAGFECNYQQHRINENVIEMDDEVKILFNHRIKQKTSKQTKKEYRKYNQARAEINKDLLRKEKLEIVKDIPNLTKEEVDILISSLK